MSVIKIFIYFMNIISIITVKNLQFNKYNNDNCQHICVIKNFLVVNGKFKSWKGFS